MKDKVNVWKFIKWVAGILRAKYWFNLGLTVMVGMFIWLAVLAASVADCGPCAGMGYVFLAIVAGVVDLAVFFVTPLDDFDDFIEMVADFFRDKWNKATGHFSRLVG